MGLRILGAVVALLLAAIAVQRHRRGQLRRGELFISSVAAAGLAIAAFLPDLFDPFLGALGFQPGNDRRIIGLLVLTNLFTLVIVLRGLSRDDQLSDEIGALVDYMALRRLHGSAWERLRNSCTVVIPAFNEADNLPSVFAEMPSHVEGLPVHTIVVADGCTDHTEDVAREHGALVIRRDLRRGSGAAVRLGYQAALRAGSALVVTMDADGQHDPMEMKNLVAPLVADQADIVQGSRVRGTFEVESRIRQLGVSFFGKILTFLSGTRITDPSNGYRALTPGALRRLELRQDQFYVSEMILESAKSGLRVVEVPITVRRRASGTTKKPKALRYAVGFTKAIVRTWLRQPPGARRLRPEPRWLADGSFANGTVITLNADEVDDPEPSSRRVDHA